MGTKAKLFKIIIPVLIVLGGLAVMFILIKSRHEPQRVEREIPGTLVQTKQVSPSDWTATVRGTATTGPGMEISIIPRVSGNVVKMAASFEEGRFLKKGDLLFRIDDTDYRLELQKSMASQAQAEYELEKIKSNAEIAREEWAIMNKGETSEAPSPLVLYEPQLKNAEAALASAKASVKLARLNLERTVISAPFDCRVRSKGIDIGQYVMAGTQVAVVSSTDTAEAVVQLKQDELDWIDIPKSEGSAKGSKAIISALVNGKTVEWNGRVIRTMGEVDEKSRTVQVVVEIKDPYRLKSRNGNKLLNGSFVSVEIEGKKLTGAIVLPKSALRDNSTVWLMDDEGLLRIRKVRVLRSEEDSVIIDKGLEDNDRVILTRISGASEGMKLREAGEATK